MRAALCDSDSGPRREEAVRQALSELNAVGVEGAAFKWWAFEGFTSVDCCLETDRLVLFIEGKRLEPPAATVSWITPRHQIARNLEVAAQYAARSERDFAVLLVGPDGCSDVTAVDLKPSWPHLDERSRDELLARFLGITSWRELCRVTGLAYDELPITTEDAHPVVTARSSVEFGRVGRS
jgi:hypothetical protein